MPRVALITEERVVRELSSFPAHKPHPACGFHLTREYVLWTNGAVALRWNRLPTSESVLLQAGAVVSSSLFDFDSQIPGEEEPTSSVGLDTYLAYRILKLLGAPNGHIQHVGNVYMVHIEPKWEDIIREVDVLIAGIA